MASRIMSLQQCDQGTISEIAQACGVTPDDIEDVYAGTPLQLGMMADSSKRSGAYNYRLILNLKDRVDIERFLDAFSIVVSRNPILRTRFADSAVGILQATIRERYHTLRYGGTITDYLEEDGSRPIGMGQPLLRSALVERTLVITLHHAIGDQVSNLAFLTDVSCVYQGKEPELHAPYKDFVHYCSSISDHDAESFWKPRFQSIPAHFPTAIPNHVPNPTEHISQHVDLGASAANVSIALVPSYIEVAWALTARAYTGSDSVAFGLVLSGRSAALGGLETTLGPTLVTVPVQVDLPSHASIKDVLQERSKQRRQLQSHVALQYGLARIRKISAEAKATAAFQTLLSIRPTGDEGTGFQQFTVEKSDVVGPYGISLTATLAPSGILLEASSDPHVLEKKQLQRVLHQFEHSLKWLLGQPLHATIDQYPALNVRDQAEVMAWNGFIPEPVERTLHDIFADQVRLQPKRPAVVAADGSLSYEDLDTLSERLAQQLVHKGLAVEEPVAFIFEKSRWTIVAILAILKAGGACVPIDASSPHSRKLLLMSLAGARFLLTSEQHSANCVGLSQHALTVSSMELDKLLPVGSSFQATSRSSPSNLAYIMFTSGSTGEPKGVLLEHRSLASSLNRLSSNFGWGSCTRTLQFAAYVWDASLLEIFGAVLFGGCICMPSQAERESGLASFMNSAKTTWALLTPAVLRTISPDEVPHLEVLASGGEAIDVDATALWSRRLCFLNCYGPAEASIISTLATLSPDSPYPQTIGRATGCATWVVDPDNANRLLPIGATGELVVQGPNVARGYLNNDIKTAHSFIKPPSWATRGHGPGHRQGIAHSTASQRMYRTGDLVRYNPDGSLCFMGRRDQQVKLRGQRFELGEVEASLSKCPGVREVFAGIVITATGHKDLAAVVTLSETTCTQSASHVLQVLDSTQLAHVDTLKRQVQAFAHMQLPSHMVPTLWFAVSGLPTSTSDKLDRKRISSWLQEQNLETAKLLMSQGASASTTTTPPKTPEETALQAVWSSVLGIPKVDIGRESDFIALGGDSISAMSVATRLRKQEGFQIAVAALLGSGSLAQAAVTCTALHHPSNASVLLNSVTSTSLSPVQRLFFENDGPAAHNHFNHSWVLELRSDVSAKALETTLAKVVDHHAMLRARFKQGVNGAWHQEIEAFSSGAWHFAHHQGVTPDSVPALVEARQATMDIHTGPVFSADLIEKKNGSRLLLLVAHHIVVDLVSWRVVWEDIETLVHEPQAHLPDSASFLTWTEHQAQSVDPTDLSDSWPKANLGFWNVQDKLALSGNLIKHRLEFDPATTELVMGSCNLAYNTTPTELLLAATFRSFQRIFADHNQPAVYCEGHGRPLSETALDVSRTVGWFTTLTPVVPSAAGTDLTTIAMIKDSYRDATVNSLHSFTSRMASTQPLHWRDIELLFNFAGRLQQINQSDSLFSLDARYSDKVLQVADNVPQPALISVSAAVQGECLQIWVEYNGEMAHQDRLRGFVDELKHEVERFSTTLPGGQSELTLHDMPLLHATYQDLPRIHRSLTAIGVPASNVETILPCTPMQEGMLLAQFKGHENAYLGRFIFRLSGGSSLDVYRVADAWRLLCKTHKMLRTLTTSGLCSGGAFQQLVLKKTEPRMVHLEAEGAKDICSVLKAYARPRLQPDRPTHQMTLASGSGHVYAMLDISHVLSDARTMQLLALQLRAAYLHPLQVPISPSFDEHVAHLQKNRETSHKYWVNHLRNAQPTLLPHVENGADSNAEDGARAIDVPFANAPELLAFCKKHSLTVANVVQVGWGLVLQQLTGSYDVLFGYLFSGRDASEEAQNTIGPFINMLTCRIQANSDLRVLTVLEKAKADFSAGLENSACVLGELQDALGVGSSPLFDTAMSVQHTWTDEIKSQGSSDLAIELEHVEDPTEFPLTVNVMYTKNSFACKLFYQAGKLPRSLAEDLATTYAATINCIIRDDQQSIGTVHASSILPPPRPLRSLPALLDRWNGDSVRAVDSCLHELFRTVAKNYPTAPAVCSWDRSLSYGDLDILSEKLAAMLQRMSIGPACIVPFVCEKSALAPVIMLGILKAGAIMLPLDITHPVARLTSIVQEANAAVVVCSSTLQHAAAQLAPQTLAIDFKTLEDEAYKIIQNSTTPSDGCYVISTSGSTGKPKMILVEHRNVATSITSHLQPLGVNACTRVLQIATFAFDASVAEVFFPLLAGGCICMPSDAERSENIAAAIVRTSANFSFMTPSMARLLKPSKVPTLRTLALMGEAMTQDDAELWKDIRLINAYGPAEGAIISSCGDVDHEKANAFANIGRPYGCAFFVTEQDDHNVLAPIGSPGELIIHGPSVAREYLNDPEKTAAAFISAPEWTKSLPSLQAAQSDQFYKTGDLVAQNTDGSISYLGRKGLQVKIRGQRVDLSEIEHHLTLLLGGTVSLAVETVDAHGDKSDGRLVAFLAETASEGLGDGSSNTLGCMLTDPQPGQAALLREGLQKVVAPYMVPDLYVRLQTLPLSPSGKTDRKQLRELGAALSKSELMAYSALRKGKEENLPKCDLPIVERHWTEHERILQGLWSKVLGMPHESIAREDNFLAIGGNSIKVIQLVAAARDQELQLTVADIFGHPVLSELAAVVRTTAIKESTIAPFTLLSGSPDVESLCQHVAAVCGVSPSQVEDMLPATAIQEGLLAMASKRSGDYVAQMVLPLGTSTNLDAFKKAWEAVVASAPILRTRLIDIPEHGVVQVVLQETVAWTEYVDLETELASELQAEMTLGSSLSRVGIHVDCVSGTKNFVLTLHHAIYDGWSMSLLLDAVEDAYHDRSPRLVSFKPFIRHLCEQKLEDVERFWSSQFAGLEAPPFPTLPSAEYTPRANATFEHSVTHLKGSSSAVTMSTIVRTAWALLLGSYTGTPDAVFGAIVSGRQASVPDIERIAGPTIATVPVRVRLEGKQTVESLLHRVQQQSLDMNEFEQTGLRVIKGINSEAQIACGFQTLLLIQPPEPSDASKATKDSLFLQEKTSRNHVAFDAFSTYSIMLVCELQADGLRLRFAYDNHVVEHAQVSRMGSQLDHLLHQLCDIDLRGGTLANLQKISSDDLHDIWSWNAAVPSTVEESVHDLISKTAHMQPQALAIQAWDGNLTYDGLDECSDTLSSHLLALGLSRGDVVTLLFPKSMWTAVAALGVWKAGGAALLLDVALPRDRLATIIAEAKPRLMICAASLVTLSQSLAPSLQPVPLDWSSFKVMDGMEQSAELPTWHPSDVLYMVFTSGSTGTPKGALVTHSNFASALRHQAASLGLTPSSRVLDISAYSFDMAWYTMLHTLYTGACLCIPSDQERKDDLSGATLRYGATFVNLTPKVASLLDGDALRQLKKIEMAGETASKELLDRLRTHDLQISNAYGPAECTAIVVSSNEMRTPSHIGRGAGAVTWLMDPLNTDHLVPVGCIGELFIEGPLVGKGYLGRPEQTAAAFVEDPEWLTQGYSTHPGRSGRLYRTGDLARYEADGSLSLLGRRDGQVKIRGQRVELAEIEHHIHALLEAAGHAGLHVVAEVAKPLNCDSARLVALLVPTGAKNMTEQRLCQEVSHMIRGLDDKLATLVPQYMVPDAYVPLVEIPHTATGKTDRRRLREKIASMELKSLSAAAEYVAPSTELEAKLQSIFSDVLNIPATSISVEAPFRSLGDSIQAMQLVAKCRREQIGLTTERLLRLQTIRNICKEHEASTSSGCRLDQSIAKVLPAEQLHTLFDLSPIQQWYFDTKPAKMCFDVPLLLVLQRRSSPKLVRRAMERLVARHSMLRARFEQDAATGRWKQLIHSDVESSYSFEYHAVETETALASTVKNCRAGLDIEQGPLIAARLIETGDSQLLFVTTHHLVMDYMSWRILIAELDDLLSRTTTPAVEQAPSHSFQHWVLAQAEYTRSRLSPELALPANHQILPAQLDYWGLNEAKIQTMRYATRVVTLDTKATSHIMESPYIIKQAFTPFELLMSALFYSFSHAFPDRPLPPCFAEGHGREPWSGSTFDLSQTVSWFTTIFPIQLPPTTTTTTSPSRSLAETIRAGAHAMRSLPHHGFDYMSTRYLHPRGPEHFHSSQGTWELNFNFLGTFYQFEKEDSLFHLQPLPSGSDPESTADFAPTAVFDIGAVVIRGELQVTFKYACAEHFVDRLAGEYERVLRSFGAGGEAGGR